MVAELIGPSHGTFTPRERIRRALDHEQADRVPFDLGGIDCTGIARSTYIRLLEHLGFPPREVGIWHVLQQLAELQEDFLKWAAADTRPLVVNPPDSWKLDIFDEGGNWAYRDQWGTKLHMPKDGYYFDFCEFPLKESTINALRTYRFPDPDDPGRTRGLAEKAQKLNDETFYTIVGSALFGGGVFEQPARLLGPQDWFIALASDQKFADVMLGEIAERYAQACRNFLSVVGENVQVMTYWDDLGGQNGPIISPEMYRKLIKPKQKMVFDTIKSVSKAKILYHNCGAVADLIPDMLDIGVDVLNPIQVSAVGMDTAELKRKYGKQLSFWGAAVDSQRVLPFGTPEEVREEAKKRIVDLAPGGGFVYAPIHNIQPNVPPENVVALIETVREFGTYA